MNQIESSLSPKPENREVRAEEIAEDLEKRLETWAPELIERYVWPRTEEDARAAVGFLERKQRRRLDSSEVREIQELFWQKNRQFRNAPDDPAEHAPTFHQWGIITHTKKFREFYKNEIPDYLRKWGLANQVDQSLAQTIDGRPRSELLEISIPLHDLGKFSERTLQITPQKKILHLFNGHEEASGRLIRQPDFQQLLTHQYQLTPEQIEYIASCADRHYEIAIVRNEAKKSPGGYNLAFARGDRMRQESRSLAQKWPNMAVEMGLLFLADSLAKSQFRLSSDTNQEIQQKKPAVEQALKDHDLPAELSFAVEQLAINTAAARTYLEEWASRSSEL